MARLQMWLEKALRRRETISEVDVGEKLVEFRRQQEGLPGGQLCGDRGLRPQRRHDAPPSHKGEPRGAAKKGFLLFGHRGPSTSTEPPTPPAPTP